MLDTDTIQAFLEDRHLELARELHDFCSAELLPRPHPEEDAGARAEAPELVRLFAAQGWLQHLEPFDLRACCLVREALGASAPLADALFALQCLGSMPILLAGDNPAGTRWVEAVRAGDAIAGFAMTEPEAGSDVASMTTRAVKDGNSYILDGHKTLISNAGLASFYCVFASTDPEAGHRGLSIFVVPADTPGLHFEGAQVLSVPHPLGGLRFESCRVPASHRLGAEGDGFKLGMGSLDRLRPSVGAAACGMASRALHASLGHACTRRQFGEPLAELQLVQQRLATMATELSAARLLVYRAAHAHDRGQQRITLEAAMGKLYATEAAQRIVDSAVQIHGGLGTLAAHPVDQLYRAVRALRIYEGSSEVQHLVIARQVLRAFQSGQEA